MKLHYFQDPAGNFGDDLNPWLWPRVAPGLIDADAGELLVGIGTLLNHRLPAAPIKHVMGSGVGYGALPSRDQRLVVHAVRGHGTARALGLPADSVITDAAVLLRAIEKLPAPRQRAKVNLVLTGESIRDFDWQPVCEAAGIGLISCHESVDEVIAAIRGSELILADAMHGAIAADTLRVPWVAVTCNPHILASKWQDWLSSLALDYAPAHIEPLFDGDRGRSALERAKRRAKMVLSHARLYRGTAMERRRSSTGAAVEKAVAQLREAARARPSLSDVAVVDRCIEQFMARLGALTLRQRRASTERAA